MLNIESLKRKIQSTEDLKSVVKTMKALAAVNIRQYERAVKSLADYNQTVELGLMAVLKSRPGYFVGARKLESKGQAIPTGAIFFGSDQGMCGPLNEQVFNTAENLLKEFNINKQDMAVLAMGERLYYQLENAGYNVEKHLSMPGSVTGITSKVHDVLLNIESWTEKRGISRVYLFYNKMVSSQKGEGHAVRLLPLDENWLNNLQKTKWPTRNLPMFTMDFDPLFSALINQYLFISLFRAFAESLASENAQRLASMQSAEKNIKERLEELNTQFHQMRQMGITEELLDIVSGFEALEQGKKQTRD
jgi:F-type H+-transporting ATPase subunit gamma